MSSSFDFFLGDLAAAPATTPPKKDNFSAQSLDWLLLDNDTVPAPHPDAFDLELESLAALGGLDQIASSVTVDNSFNPLDFGLYRSNGAHSTYSAYSGYGPSTVTCSSETLSAYGSAYEPSSLYDKIPEAAGANSSGAQQQQHNHQRLPTSLASLFPEVDLSFNTFNLESDRQSSSSNSTAASVAMIPRLTLDTNPSAAGAAQPQSGDKMSSRSHAYDSSTSPQFTAADYYLSSSAAIAPNYGAAHPSLAGGIGHHNLTKVETIDANLSGGEQDARKKYQCPTCPRAFARAFNLKTHMATHDPQRVKNFVCAHSGCGRSFSRKHDLGRHLVSIHQDARGAAAVSSSTSPVTIGSSKKSSPGAIGVGAGDKERIWCDSCGRGWLAGSRETCDCDKED